MFSVLLSSCAKIFYSSDAYSLARSHGVIAIMPPGVSITTARKVDAGAVMKQQEAESVNFQEEMYSWMLKRKMQGLITQEIQEPGTTNALLKSAGYPENLPTQADLCAILGVDGIITSDYILSEPVPEKAAVAVALLVGVRGPTNKAEVLLNVNDCTNKKVIFSYKHKYSGSVGSSPALLVDVLMRKASRKMPYIAK